MYPYECVNNVSRFDESSLPGRKHFKNQLADSETTEDDYAHAQCLWSAFYLRNLGDYHDLYVKTDVLLLLGTLEDFRVMSL